VMNETLARICEGQGREGDIEFLEKLAHTVKALSLCGLGQTAPNPVLTTIRYFRHEYETHIRDKRCPAKVCKRKFTPEEIARLKEEAAQKREALKGSEAPGSGEQPSPLKSAGKKQSGAQTRTDKKDARKRKD